MELNSEIKQLAAGFFDEIKDIRRDLHMHPELSYQEFRTAQKVSEWLNNHGIQHQTGVAGTGITGEIRGTLEGNRITCLRADLDALPILETNNASYKSVNEGVMHACGHDVHTASLLGALFILQNIRHRFGGTVRFIFQPGEEKLPGGATLMIAEGVLENPNVQSILGQHVYTPLRAGTVGFRSGMYMASTDEVYLTVKGKGGHAAIPEACIDPVIISAQILVALQQVKSRFAPAAIPTVLSFGKVLANGVTNVIPDIVSIEGTFRTMNEQWREKAHGLIAQIAQHTAQAYGAECDVRIEKGYPFLVNDPEVTVRAKKVAEEYVGASNVYELDLRMAAEDFAWYSQQVPACFYRLGTGNPEAGINSGVHTSTFDIDESALLTGAGLMARLAIAELSV
jgi:amidohydrolase